MTTDTRSGPELCNCLAVRQAARHITQFYDQCLAASGLRTTQFSILAALRKRGPLTIKGLAKAIANPAGGSIPDLFPAFAKAAGIER